MSDDESIFDKLKHPVRLDGSALEEGDPRAEPGRDLVEGGQLRPPVHNDTFAESSETAGSIEATERFQGVPEAAHDFDAAADRRAERRVVAFFTLGVIFTVLWCVVYFAQRPGDSLTVGTVYLTYNGALGLTFGLALIFLGVGIVDWVKNLMPHEVAVQERHPTESPAAEVEAMETTFADGVDQSQFFKRPLVRRSFLAASAIVPLPMILFFRGLGSLPGKALFKTAWTPGARLVTEQGQPININGSGAMEIGAVQTVWPEGHTDAGDSPVVLIRMREQDITPVKGREDYTVFGYIAYSKICSHAGCPVSLYESQTHRLLCPCHQSTFDATKGAKPIFGPATRPLPQLAIGVDAQGYLYAKKDFDEPIGPGFWERS